MALLSAGLGLTVVLAPAGAAQFALKGDADWVEPVPVQPGTFLRTDHGDFDGDGMPDMVVHQDDRLDVMLAPGLYDQIVYGPQGVLAYGVCPPVSTSMRDSLLVSNAAGLEQFELDPATGLWSGQMLDQSWAGACLVEVREMITTVAVLGVLADRRTVRTLYRVDDQWFEQPLLVSPELIRDLCIFEFDGGGQVEIAVATDSALWVYDSTGELRATFPVGDATSVAIGRIELKYSVRDGVAWVVTRSEGLQQLIVLSPTGITPPEHLAYMPLVVDMETGDIDADDDYDIVLSHTTDHNAMVLVNQSDGWTTSFDKDKPAGLRIVKFGPKTVAPDNKMRPSLGDVDADGDSDLLLPVQSNGDLFVWRSSKFDESKFDPTMDLDVLESTCNLEALGNGDLSMTLRLQVDLPEGTPATHVELVVWHRASIQTPTEPVAVQRVLVPISGTAPQSLTAQVLLQQVPDIVPGTDVRFEGFYFWAQRAVRVENGVVVQRWHPRSFGIETSPEPDNYSWMKSLGGAMLFPVQQSIGGTALPDLIGCGSELPNLPNFPGGKVPTWM